MSRFGISLSLRSPLDAAAAPPGLLRSWISGCARGGLVRAFHVSDAPGSPGEPASRTLVAWVLAAGAEPVVTLAAAGMSAGSFLEQVREWRRAGVRRFLFVTGNHPEATAQKGPLFDIDSLQMQMLLRRAAADGDGSLAGLSAGVVVSPGKTLEAELLWQYERLRRKIEAGADFIVAQPGYDPRSWDELARFCRLGGVATAPIGSVLIADPALAHRIAAGEVPGVAVPPSLLGRMLARNGRGGLELAAAALATLRGLGYQGAILCGRPLAPDELAWTLEEAGRLQPRWRECLAEFRPALPRFSYFREDPATGLNTDEPGAVAARGRPGLLYRFSELVDSVAFGARSPVFRALVRVCRFCDTRPLWRRGLWLLEYLSKAPLYRCRMCGDCTLYACGFLCVESGCPKRMVNGPCGGSREGRCEIPGRGTCLWVKAYERLKAQSDRPGFPAAPVPPKDRRLSGGCSWINYCLGRDHRGRPFLPTPAEPPGPAAGRS